MEEEGAGACHMVALTEDGTPGACLDPGVGAVPHGGKRGPIPARVPDHPRERLGSQILG